MGNLEQEIFEGMFNDHVGQHSGMFPLGFILLSQEYKIYFVRENDMELVVDICKSNTLLSPIRLRGLKEEGYMNMRYFISMVLRNFESILYQKELASCGKDFDIEKRFPMYEKYRRMSILLND